MMTYSSVTRLGLLLLAASMFVAVLGIDSHAEQTELWQPPEPLANDFDWIRLKSGEWLKGELKSLRDKDIEFDSDKLDLLKLDFDDVAEFRFPHIYSFRFDDLGVFTGTSTMRNGVIKIKSAGKVHELPREKLLILVEADIGEFSRWSGKASIGFIGRSGNSDQADLNAIIQFRRQSPKGRINLKYTGNLGEVQGEGNINNHSVNAFYDLIISSGFFITPVSVDFFKDRFQNIDHKFTLATGLGYAFLQGGDVDWRVGLTGGYLATKYRSVEAGEEDIEKSGTVIPSTSLEADVTDNIEFDFDYNIQIGIGKVNNTFHHASGMFSIDIFGDILDLDLSVTWDRVENPKTDAEGNVPKKNDLRMSFGIGVQF
jgi:putative salt-induced outer membrane protein YdiY